MMYFSSEDNLCLSKHTDPDEMLRQEVFHMVLQYLPQQSYIGHQYKRNG